jgi:hypothetical protein
MMRKSFTAVVLVLGMALGSVLTMVLNPVGAASALVGATSTKGGHESVLQQALDTLVGKGTLTQAQADALKNEMQSDRSARMAKRPHIGKKVFVEVAGALKMTPKALRQELAKGKSIAQVATEKGVNPTALANQITAALDKRINARVSGHHLQQQSATTMEQHLPARVNAFLNHKWDRHAHSPNGATPKSNGATTTTTH